ncbi:glycosyltransferase [uncultured Akkermansia sp.]|uniref:glycosyltransferase n=1 Tax=Akkermansia sp. TaxID=1872421 RepID=UPI0025E8AB0F|nr:glycosyltransferase [uncultured Akkermansia sp.]
MERICAIFSHYRRISLTEVCLRRLARQTVPLHRVVVADNGAGDGTLDGVKEQAAAGAYPFILEVIDMPRNTGNAGGIARGLERAFSFPDVDAVWILDDDSWPEPDALACLLSHKPGTDGMEWPCVRVCKVVDLEQDGELSWPMVLVDEKDGRRIHVTSRDTLPDAPFLLTGGAFLGALVPREIHDKVRGPTAGLFIRGEDEEYPWIISHAGFRTYLVSGSILHHPRPATGLVLVEVGGKAFYYEPGLDACRLYYKVRNWAWLQRFKHPHSPLFRWAACAGYAALCGVLIAVYNSWSPSKFRAVCLGVYRGACGRLAGPDE